MSLTVSAAFEHLRKNLEITTDDEALAIRRRGDIYERLKKDIDLLSEPLLTGSFHRDTKTRPLKDVDFFCPMRRTSENLKNYRDQHPALVLDAFEESLFKRYGDRVSQGRRSVQVSFGSEDTRILSYDVVPAFERTDGKGFDIPDKDLGRWIVSDPRVHRERARQKNKDCDGRWKPLVKMLKTANRTIEDETGQKAIKPSFLIEVMGLEVFDPPLDDWPVALQIAFATLAEHVDSSWPDPSGGPEVNEMDSLRRQHAREQLRRAQELAQDARHLQKTSERQAILKWKELFGSLMPID
ncbi:MAG: hypothetical protein QOI62_3116 [Solirubrobacteraceae bacterium]|jgi:hypothetical protein|nr:hypothetical protein [Solirubrobacteraceae bacterium]